MDPKKSSTIPGIKNTITTLPLSRLHPNVRVITKDHPKDFSIPKDHLHPTWTLEKTSRWIESPQEFLKSWDTVADANTATADETHLNTITRLIIVLAILILIIGAGHWWIMLILVGIVLFIIWLTVIPTMLGAQNGLIGISENIEHIPYKASVRDSSHLIPKK